MPCQHHMTILDSRCASRPSQHEAYANVDACIYDIISCGLQVVEAAQTAVLELAPFLDPAQLREELLLFLDKLMDSPEHELRSAVTYLFAKLGPALQNCEGHEMLSEELLVPRLLERAEDMDFQVRRVRVPLLIT